MIDVVFLFSVFFYLILLHLDNNFTSCMVQISELDRGVGFLSDQILKVLVSYVKIVQNFRLIILFTKNDCNFFCFVKLKQ